MLTSILVFFLILSILVLVHEFGHYWVAKKNGIWVEEFGFGLPPRVFGKKIGETIYSINLLPFGGFVRLHGENELENGDGERERAFLSKSKKARFAVVVAGVVMNFLLAIFAFAIVYSFSGVPRETGQVKIVGINPDTPAAESGLKEGDIVLKIDGKNANEADDVILEVTQKGGKHSLEVKSGDVIKNFEVDTVKNEENGKWYMGVILTSLEIYYPPVWQRPFYGMYYGFKDAMFWGETVVMGFVSIFQNLFRGEVPKDIAGPIGIFAISSETSKMGILAVVNFMGILSVNLAILNIIPFPALDGGRLLFIGLESIFGKKVLPKIENYAHSIGFILLLGLLVAITYHDIRRLIFAGGIEGFINSMVQ